MTNIVNLFLHVGFFDPHVRYFGIHALFLNLKIKKFNMENDNIKSIYTKNVDLVKFKYVKRIKIQHLRNYINA